MTAAAPEAAAVAALRAALAATIDEAGRQRLRAEVKRARVLPMRLFDALALDVREQIPAGARWVPGYRPLAYVPGDGAALAVPGERGAVLKRTRTGWTRLLDWAPAVRRIPPTPETGYPVFVIRAGGDTVRCSPAELRQGRPWVLLPVTVPATLTMREVLADVVLAIASDEVAR